MSTFLVTLLLTFVLVSVAVLLFWKLGPPVYRVERVNIIRLLELVLSGQATDTDWDVFETYPIRHDDELREVQRRCLAIAEREYNGVKPYLFTSAGLQQLQWILNELKQKEQE